MTSLLDTIAAKSNQLNADDLVGRSMVVKVVKVTAGDAEQPINIFYEGGGNKPYKPGLSMRRVLVAAWGGDGSAYVGRSMELYRDDTVIFGGLAVGGIRISRMSHLNSKKTMALTAKQGVKKAYTVEPLREAVTSAKQAAPASRASEGPPGDEPPAPGAPSVQQPRRTLASYLDEKLAACTTTEQVADLLMNDPHVSPKKDSPDVMAKVNAAYARINAMAPTDALLDESEVVQ